MVWRYINLRAGEQLDPDEAPCGRAGLSPSASDVLCSVDTHPHYAHEEVDFTVDRALFTAEVIRQVAILVQPAMPVSAGKLLDLLAVPPEERSFLRARRQPPPGGGRHAPAPRSGLPPLCGQRRNRADVMRQREWRSYRFL